MSKPNRGGYIMLHRQFQSHDFWRERRAFSRAEAWLDILMAARWQDEPGEVRIGNKLLLCGRGEVLYSMKTWAQRWGWSESKTKRFLHGLAANRKADCKRTMIELTNELQTTRIKICNYDAYQSARTASEPEMNLKRTASEPGADTTKEGKKEELKRKGNSASGDTPPTPSIAKSYCGLSGESLERFEQFWRVFGYKRGKAPAARAWKRLGKLNEELFGKILEGARRTAQARPAAMADGQTPKMAQGWITDRRWEDSDVGLGFGEKTRGGVNRFGLSDTDLLG